MRDTYAWMEAVLTDADACKEALNHTDWRVRYSAAVAIGEQGGQDALDDLTALWHREEGRQLYSQPKVLGFTNSYDDTRMAEQIVAVEAIFDQEYDLDLMEDWKCRGRVRQAILCSVEKLGYMNQAIKEAVYGALEDEKEDYAVKMQACRVLRVCGDSGAIPYLEMALAVDEWCTQTEAQKAIREIVLREKGED